MPRGVKQAPQPHYHPMPGPLDARGNCRGCAAFDEASAGQGGSVKSKSGPPKGSKYK